MIADVASLNARVGGRKAELLSSATFEAVLAADSMPAVFSILHGTAYGPELDRATLRHRGAEAIEKAVAASFARSCRTLLRTAPPSLRPVVAALLAEHDLRNVLAVLRALHGGVAPESAQASLVPAGELDAPALTELLSQKGVAEACALLSTWNLPWAEALARAIPLYRRSGRLSVVESAAVAAITGWALSSVAGRGADKKLAREVIGRRLDVAIVMAKLRFLEEGGPVPGARRHRDRARRRAVVRRLRRIERAREAARGPARALMEKIRRVGAFPAQGRVAAAAPVRGPRPPVFPEGGTVFSGRRLAELLSAQDQGAVIRILEGTIYGKALGREMRDLGEITDVSVLERNLEEMLLSHFGRRYVLARPMTIAPVIGWLHRAWAEMVNLRITLRGKASGMPREAIATEWYRGA